jgi:hypothetical protein
VFKGMGVSELDDRAYIKDALFSVLHGDGKRDHSAVRATSGCKDSLATNNYFASNRH